MKKKTVIMLFVLISALFILTGWIIWDNNRIVITEFAIADPDIPEDFSGFRILQISDFHNRDFNNELAETIEALHPDIILITGDLIDSYHTDIKTSLAFIRKLVNISPVYYVSGNHEVRVPLDYQRLKEGLLDTGVTVLDNASVTLEHKDEKISLLGIPDPSAFHTNPEFYASAVDNMIQQKITHPELYTVALCHRPEVFDSFVANGIDLVFSGHTHGGQIRLPWIGAVFCPDQGLFPEFDAGLFTEDNTTMIICRGLGNSSFPFRINCPPEIVVATLVHK